MEGKNQERVTFAASSRLVEELDAARGTQPRSAFVREVLESSLWIKRSSALKPWIGVSAARDLRRDS